MSNTPQSTSGYVKPALSLIRFIGINYFRVEIDRLAFINALVLYLTVVSLQG